MNNYNLINCDTDAIMIAKSDGAPWTEEEQAKFLEALNSQFPEKIVFEHDGYYDSVCVFGSKNYALLPHGATKIKTKGSSIRDQKKEPALREMMDKMIEAMIYHRLEELPGIYKQYIKEALNVQDISRWAQKKTLTESILVCKGYTQADIKSKKVRKNETDVWDAVANEVGMQQGDKFYTYPVIIGNNVESGRIGKNGKPLKDKVSEVTGYKLTKYFTGDHDVEKLLERVYATVKIFELVLDMSQFVDYTKSKSKAALEQLKGEN